MKIEFRIQMLNSILPHSLSKTPLFFSGLRGNSLEYVLILQLTDQVYWAKYIMFSYMEKEIPFGK